MSESRTPRPGELPWPGSTPSFIAAFWAYAVATGLGASLVAELVSGATRAVLPTGPTRMVITAGLVLLAGLAADPVLTTVAQRRSRGAA